MEKVNDMALVVPVSWGELLDKISILQIKSERMEDGRKKENVGHELALLEEVRDRQLPAGVELTELLVGLRRANEQLWEIEDRIRVCEKNQQFDQVFIELARSVYTTNDRRAALKYRINILLGSAIVEEKAYAPYAVGS